MRKLRLAILISGRGSNMQALIDACQQPDYPAEIVCVLSNNPDAVGLQKASDAGLATATIDHRDYDNRDMFEQALVDHVQTYQPDVICLAGFMRLLKGAMLEMYPNAILNVHPSLLPAYKGLNVHERVIAAGEVESGCSVHIVVPDMDAGPVLVQRSVPVLDNDTPDALANRILVEEHIAYPQAVAIMASRLKSCIAG